MTRTAKLGGQMPWYPATTLPRGDPPRPAEAWIAVDVDARAILLIPAADGWLAIEDRCSHAGCAFSEDGELDGSTVICGCHGSEFDIRTGAVIRSPAERPIDTFPTRVAEGIIEVELP